MDDKSLFDSIANLYEATSSINDSDSEAVACIACPVDAGVRERKTWSAVEDAAIIECLKKHGCKWRCIARDVKFASDDAIRNRVLRMNIESLPDSVRAIVQNIKLPRQSGIKKHIDVKAYTSTEDSIILHEISLRRKSPWKTLSEGALSPRTAHSIRNRAYRLLARLNRNSLLV